MMRRYIFVWLWSIILSIQTAYSFQLSVLPQSKAIPQSRTSPRSFRAASVPTFLPLSYEQEQEQDVYSIPPPSLLSETTLVLRRLSWLSWWAQIILTTVSAVTLGFARGVAVDSSRMTGSTGTFFLAGTGIVSSVGSILWTWANGWRLTRRLRRPQTSLQQAVVLLKRAIRVGCWCNLTGLCLSLLGAEQIVGVLAIKVLTNINNLSIPSYPVLAAGQGLIQPLDILVVQANTNLLLSHFVSLVCLLLLTRQVEKLYIGMDTMNKGLLPKQL